MPLFPQVEVVGMHFRGGGAKDVAAALSPGDSVRLEREPDNAYDAYAIKVFVEDLHIGYIERGQAAWIAPYMDDEKTPEAIVTGHKERNRNIHPILSISFNDV